MAGEPAYEVGPLFYNPQPEIFQLPNLVRSLERRLAVLSEHLQIDRQRLHACAFAHSVLSARVERLKTTIRMMAGETPSASLKRCSKLSPLA